MISQTKNEGSYSTRFVLWIIFYCYATFAALIFQKLLLPLFPDFHGGGGLIGGGDSFRFHEIASDLADLIRLHGWGKWTIWLPEGITGNVSLLAVLYVIFGNDPTVIIPVNAAVHATSGLFIFLIAGILWPGRVGVYSGVIAASLFVIFPSALNWYAQIHKDGFAILGMLVVFYSWLKAIQHLSRLRSFLWIILGTSTGLLFIIFVRPYNVKLLILSAGVFFVSVSVNLFFSRNIKQKIHLSIYFIILIALLMIVNNNNYRYTLIEHSANLPADSNWHWKQSSFVPEKIDSILKNTAEIRVHNILHNKRIKARSLIDEGERPDDAWSVVRYMPRAVEIGLFAPFPKMWFEKLSITRIVSTGETVIWYLLIPGIFLTCWFRRSLPLFVMAANAVLFLGIYAFILPNIGTLYRLRYVYIFILMLIGVMGWVELARRKLGDNVKNVHFRMNGEDTEAGAIERSHEAISTQVRSTLAATGFAVITFTLLSSVLFVVRDVVLARWFGLSNELDAFFVAMIVPMLFVNIMSFPIGTVMVPALLGLFKSGAREKAQHLITVCSTTIFCCMLVICLLLLAFSSYYISVLGWGFSMEKIAQSHRILIIVLPILFFSGFLILGNSILNARQKFVLPALAQSIVPIIVILTLLTVARQIGIYAMAIGMCIGHIANLLIVGYHVRKEGLTIFPVVFPSAIKRMINRSSGHLKDLLFQYLPLAFSSVFISLAMPINNTIAASLGTGNVSALNLGTKFVVFFTGIIGTGIATVMLPYFSSYFVRNHIMDARRELSFFLFLAAVISMPLTLILYFFTGSAVRFVFGGGVFTVGDIGAVTRVVEYGIIQLPFFCTNMLFAKYANAKQKNALIMIASFLGLVLNVILNFVFIGRMGVGGIALASSLSVMFSTILFIIVGHGYNDVSWIDVIFIALTWFLFLTTILCYHFRSTPGVIIASTSLILTVVYHLMEFFERTTPTEPRV